MRASLDQKNIYLYLISVYISHIIFQLQRLVRLIWDYIETIYETISLKVICDVWSIIYILDMNRYDIFAIFNIFGPWRELIVRNSTPCSPAASAVLLTTHSMEEAEAAMSNFEGEKWFDNLTIWLHLVGSNWRMFQITLKVQTQVHFAKTQQKSPKLIQMSIDTSWSIKSY